MLALYVYIMNWVHEKEEGQDLIEYALIAGLIALAAVAFILITGGSIQSIWEKISTSVANAAGKFS